MEITTEALSRFTGGQLEIQNRNEGYLYRGEIESVEVDDDSIRVKFAWLAKGEGYPPLPERWVNDEGLDYAVSRMFCSASDIGDGRVTINVSIVWEVLVFFPPDGSKLDPAKVEGLVLVAEA